MLKMIVCVALGICLYGLYFAFKAKFKKPINNDNVEQE